MKVQNKNGGKAANSGGIIAGDEIRREMSVDEIAHAPWNPRTEAELSQDHPAMAELIKSVRELGVVQPIVVWIGSAAAQIAGEGRTALCIGGNRRLEAARLVGLKTIPTHAFTDLDETTARAITRAENECRFGVSPLADAQLVKSMMDLGRSQSEIAALLGVSEATVCRRVKLLDLSRAVVREIGEESVDARALEKIAAYPKELQDKAAKKFKEKIAYHKRITPNVVDDVFQGLTCRLDRQAWIYKGEAGRKRLEKCLVCPLCTGNQPELFDLVGETHGQNDADEGEGERRCLGRCTNPKCYRKLEAETKAELIAAAIDRGSNGAGADGIVSIGSSFNWHGVCSLLRSNRRTKKDTYAYVYFDTWNHMAYIKWGPNPAVQKQAAKKKDADKKAAREEYDRQCEAAGRAVDVIVSHLFGPLEKGELNADHCAGLIKAWPIDFIAEMLARFLAGEFGDTWNLRSRAEICRKLASNLPEIRTLISAEDFAALGNV